MIELLWILYVVGCFVMLVLYAFNKYDNSIVWIANHEGLEFERTTLLSVLEFLIVVFLWPALLILVVVAYVYRLLIYWFLKWIIWRMTR